MITPPLKTHISSRASYLSPTDYKDIMQYRDMKSKPLAQLSKKYNISNSRLYQIWRGQEFNRIQWNDLAVISNSKAKKTEGRKSRTKAVCASDSISPTVSSEDVLDLYKRTSSEIEKFRASGRPLITK
ncbi:hypothetical protein GLOIN_2v1836991 [Rhizophagus clarus]|uniref:Uncharacterized protein n=1 Tax=Rhizophagus clarus TaxID=94130 RepID=A0A8H3LBR4_9GLOM|nr:hypothetical protein GLOIN_2v1836991 [Rhizophagus clarus]